MRFIIRTKSNIQAVENGTMSLLKRTGTWDKSTVDWGDAKDECAPISTREVAALKASHGTKTVNMARAMRVKALMIKGKTPDQIHILLRHYGTGYGPSSIRHDHAALSPTLIK